MKVTHYISLRSHALEENWFGWTNSITWLNMFLPFQLFVIRQPKLDNQKMIRGCATG